jgi:hypothetical protein
VPTLPGVAGHGVRVLEGNLRRVIGGEAPGDELCALSGQAMRSYPRYWLEAFRLPVMPVDRLVGGCATLGTWRRLPCPPSIAVGHRPQASPPGG